MDDVKATITESAFKEQDWSWFAFDRKIYTFKERKNKTMSKAGKPASIHNGH